ncbi:MAG: type II secretion system F family protein [Alphaproteobacteria bacterium]|nr:type II secretion system F family protein [Alphaproteobacteria bacterium]
MIKPLDILLLLILAIGYAIYWFKFGPGKRRKEQLLRVEQIKARRSAGKGLTDISLRRKAQETTGLAHLLLKPLPELTKLQDRLERAGKNGISAKQYLFRRLIFVLGIWLGLSLLPKFPSALAFAIAVLVGGWIPLKLLDMAISRQAKAFLRLFPDALDLMVRGLRSGLPISESFNVIATEIPNPVGAVFAEVASTMKLGVPMEKALFDIAKKLELTEFNFFTTSIVLQRETGGNLAEILNNLSEVLRSRYIMQMKIKAMSSEARASAYIIGALPFVVVAAVMAVSPKYMMPLWEDYRGNIALGIAVGMMTLGGWIMRRMTQFQI